VNQESKELRIARERIAQEAEERTGFLDLGRLGLTALPEELFELQHLQSLNLGSGYLNQEGKWRSAVSSGAANAIQADLQQLS